jgi:hypothetical protein
MDPQNASKRATELAERQFGAISRRQLLTLGFSPTRIRDWLRGGRLHARYRGVYALGRPGLGTEGELAAALLFAGPGAALGGITALWWQGLLGHRPALIHVDAPGRAASHHEIVIHHPGEVRREWHRALPIALLPQALLAAAFDLSPNALRLVLARAEFERLLDLESLHASLGEGRAGTTALRSAMAATSPS